MADPLNNKIFQDADKARAWLEALLWSNGRVCGYCGIVDESTQIANRTGYYQCNACRKQFTVMVGTVFERSHIPLNKWLMAAFLLCASKKGMSAHQMHRMLGITYKSAWFMCHRLREAMAPKSGKAGPIGGEGKSVEADVTWIGGKERNKHKTKRNSKNIGGVGKQAVRPLIDGGEVDIYEAILLAIAVTGPKEKLSYDQIRASLNTILSDKVPQKLEVSNALNHLAAIDEKENKGSRAIDWDGNALELVITDPFFRFYLRWKVKPQAD